MATTQAADVVVIGGGLLGWSAAYRLVQRGLSVIVVDRRDAGYATQAGAGMIAPGANLLAPESILPLASAAMRHYPRLIAELDELEAGETGYETVGSLLIARNDDELPDLRKAMEVIRARKAGGLGNIGELSWLSGEEARNLFPVLADLPAAIYMPEAARVDGRLLRQALETAATRMGAQALAGSASIAVHDNRASVSVDAQLLQAGSVVIAAGAWSGLLGNECGLTIPVYPQRGQIVHLELPNTNTGNWPIVEGFDTHYILTFAPHRVVCGATREHDSGFDIHLTAGGLRTVLHRALDVAPGLAPGNIVDIRVGLRPFSPDSLPIIGRAPGIDNLYICTGHGPSGLTLGPWSGAEIADLLMGDEPEIDLTPYAPSRFHATSSQ